MKLFLSIFIVGLSVATGFLATRSLHNRVLHLQELITALTVLEAEMKYLRDPIPYLFKNIGMRFRGPAGQLFLQMEEKLNDCGDFDFYTNWCKSVHEVYGGGSLIPQDIDILCETGIELGKTDIEGQKGLFKRIFIRLEQQTALAETEKITKGRVRRSLCTAGGVLFVIVSL